jgi:hypothetical protein
MAEDMKIQPIRQEFVVPIKQTVAAADQTATPQSVPSLPVPGHLHIVQVPDGPGVPEIFQSIRDQAAECGVDLGPFKIALAPSDVFKALHDTTTTHSSKVLTTIKVVEGAAKEILSLLPLPPAWKSGIETGDQLLGVVFQCGDVICAGPLTTAVPIPKQATRGA